MLIKNQVYEARIVDYTADGQGVAKIEGCAVFVANGVVGDLCKIAILKANKTWALGKITQVIEKSPHRVQRECPISASCGGCDFWHMDYEEESRLKAERVRQALNRIGGESLEEVPILAAPTCYGYRNKAQYPVAAKKGRVYAGFFKAGTHQVVENEKCLILPDETEQVKNIKTVYDFSESKLSPHRIALVFDKDGKECLAIFEGTAKAAKILASLCENGKSLKGKTFHG